MRTWCLVAGEADGDGVLVDPDQKSRPLTWGSLAFLVKNEDTVFLQKLVNFNSDIYVTELLFADCNGAFCSRKGAGSFAVGSCKEVYCDCDAGGNAFPRDCPGHLIFDALLGFCNWRALIPKCTAKWTTLFDPKFYL